MIELEINNIKTNRKPSCLETKQYLKLNNTFLNNQWIREGISMKIGKHFELIMKIQLELQLQEKL